MGTSCTTITTTPPSLESLFPATCSSSGLLYQSLQRGLGRESQILAHTSLKTPAEQLRPLKALPGLVWSSCAPAHTRPHHMRSGFSDLPCASSILLRSSAVTVHRAFPKDTYPPFPPSSTHLPLTNTATCLRLLPPTALSCIFWLYAAL